MTELKTVNGDLLKNKLLLTYNQETQFLTFFPIASKWLKKKKKKSLFSQIYPKSILSHICCQDLLEVYSSKFILFQSKDAVNNEEFSVVIGFNCEEASSHGRTQFYAGKQGVAGM